MSMAAPGSRSGAILILGATGSFGRLLARRLARHKDSHVILAARRNDKLAILAAELTATYPAALIKTVCVHAPMGLADVLVSLKPAVLVDASGPFQHQDYQTARCCIKAGVHYIDIADSRDFVVNFATLNSAAKAAGVMAISGASSVPGLSSAVVAHLASDDSHIDRISISIIPGNRAPRGLSVVQAILSYVGKPIPTLVKGQWTRRIGWQDLRRYYIKDIGWRWVSACDVPDIRLLPVIYAQLRTVEFHAGLELSFLHLGLWLLSWFVRWGLVRSLVGYAKIFQHVASWFQSWGSDQGAMIVEVEGPNIKRRWILTAEAGHGPYVPVLLAAILARQISLGQLAFLGARPCLNIVTLKSFLEEIEGLNIHCHER